MGLWPVLALSRNSSPNALAGTISDDHFGDLGKLLAATLNTWAVAKIVPGAGNFFVAEPVSDSVQCYENLT